MWVLCPPQSLRTSGDGKHIRDAVAVAVSSLDFKTLFLSSNISAPLLMGLYVAFPSKIICKKKLFDEINSFNLHGYQKNKNNIKIWL